ncbi:hypothetical protein [Archangium sp.]|uniref:hypothetical protein n=1 Tax=Archangium sp. TaxID=1872627 RepID=UPI002D3FCEE3|nr:hypothetical protein [Archangium sp.]HYO59576.1 hypothetical protein [Archangium sp.]
MDHLDSDHVVILEQESDGLGGLLLRDVPPDGDTCPLGGSEEVLYWFLARTDFSFIYADASPTAERFPAELKEIAAAEKKIVIDLAVTSARILKPTAGTRNAG